MKSPFAHTNPRAVPLFIANGTLRAVSRCSVRNTRLPTLGFFTLLLRLLKVEGSV